MTQDLKTLKNVVEFVLFGKTRPSSCACMGGGIRFLLELWPSTVFVFVYKRFFSRLSCEIQLTSSIVNSIVTFYLRLSIYICTRTYLYRYIDSYIVCVMLPPAETVSSALVPQPFSLPRSLYIPTRQGICLT